MRISIDMDEYVGVELTLAGKGFIAATYPKLYPSLHPGRLQALIESDQKRTKWQLSELFRLFGGTFAPDGIQVFKNNTLELFHAK